MQKPVEIDIPSIIKRNFPFKEFYGTQFEIISYIVNSMYNQGKTNFIFEGPTGTGKSVIGFTVGKVLQSLFPKVGLTRGAKTITSPRIIICTSSRQLQMQYKDTFGKFQTEHLWSSLNYPCINPNMVPEDEVSYGSGACLGNKCPQFEKCPYLIQKNKFRKAEIGIINYYYFMHTCEFNPDILICDEAHNLPQLICNMNSLSLSEKSLTRLYKTLSEASVTFKDNIDTLLLPLKIICRESIEDLEQSVFRDYCEITLKQLQEYDRLITDELDQHNRIREDLIETSTNTSSIDKDCAKLGKAADLLQSMIEKFKNYLTSKGPWVISEKDTKVTKLTIKPLEVTEGMKDLIDRSNRVLYLSATICGPVQFAKELGLDFTTCDYLNAPCPFPVKNRQISLLNLGALNYKNKETLLPTFLDGIDTIISKLTDNWKKIYSGIIHTVSYENAEYIKKHSKHKKKIFIPTKQDLLELNSIIKNSKQGIVICSPSITEGVDLFDDLSRFQIWMKTPYGYLGDRWVNTKMKLDAAWYARETIIRVVQGCGRSVRSIDDWAWTFILDSSFERLLNQNRTLFPNWFLEAIVSARINND